MARDHFDRLAETAVKEAIQQLAASGKRADSRSVPSEAQLLVSRKSRGRLTESAAAKRVEQAIARLKDRKEIKAPAAAYTEWALLDEQQTESLAK